MSGLSHVAKKVFYGGRAVAMKVGLKPTITTPMRVPFGQCSNVGEYVSLGKHNTDRIVECVSWKVDQVPMVVESWVSVLPRNLL